MMKLCLVSNAQFVWENLIIWGARELKGKELRVIGCKLAWWSTVTTFSYKGMPWP